MTKQELLQNPLVSEIARDFASKVFVNETVTDWAQYRRLQNTIPSPLLVTEDNISVYSGAKVHCLMKNKVWFTIEANEGNVRLYRNAGVKFYAIR